MKGLQFSDFANAPFEIIDGDRGKKYPKQNDLLPSGHCLFLNASNVTRSGFEFSQCQFITEQRDEMLRKGKLKRDDVILTTRGTIGNAAHFSESIPYDNLRINSGMVIFRCDSKRILPKYLYHFLRSSSFHSQVKCLQSGVAQPQLPIRDMKRIKIPLPSITEQINIVSVLSAYDDLIANNRRRMALLEEAARQLYEEWFVRLRFPGHEHVRIVDGIPEGWMTKRLSDIAEFRLGKMLDQKKNKGDLMPYLANVNVRWGEFDLRNLREMRFEDNELDAFGLKYSDIVMCEGGEPGRCAIWKDQLPGMMIQKALHRIRARQDVSHLYLYYSLRHKGQSGQLAMLFTGATIKHLPREKLAKVKVEIPPARLMGLFVEQASPIENQINVLETAIRRACEARDLLLPRLMSGELAV